jgi:hypothetical protein
MHLETVIILVMGSILVLGGAVTFFAFKAYRRTGDRSLRGLMIGFSFVTLGALVGGIAHQLLNVSLDVGIVINAILTAVGFAVITYSLFTD